MSSLTVSGSGLVSGSEDGTCRVWDIASSQATRVLQMKGNPCNNELENCNLIVLIRRGGTVASSVGYGSARSW